MSLAFQQNSLYNYEVSIGSDKDKWLSEIKEKGHIKKENQALLTYILIVKREDKFKECFEAIRDANNVVENYQPIETGPYEGDLVEKNCSFISSIIRNIKKTPKLGSQDHIKHFLDGISNNQST